MNIFGGYLNENQITTKSFDIPDLNINDELEWNSALKKFVSNKERTKYPKILYKFLPIFNFDGLMQLSNINDYILINNENYILTNSSKSNNPLVFKITENYHIEQINENINYNQYIEDYQHDTPTKLIMYPVDINCIFGNIASMYNIEYLLKSHFVNNLFRLTNNSYVKELISSLFLLGEDNYQIRVNGNIIHKFMFSGKLNILLDAIYTNININNINSLTEKEIRKFNSNLKAINVLLTGIKNKNKTMLNVFEHISNNIKSDDILNCLDDPSKFKYFIKYLSTNSGIDIPENIINNFVTYYHYYYDKFSYLKNDFETCQNLFDLFYKSRELIRTINSGNINKLNAEILRDLKFYYPSIIFEITIFKHIIDMCNDHTSDNINISKILIAIYFINRLNYEFKPIPINAKHQINTLFKNNDIDVHNSSNFVNRDINLYEDHELAKLLKSIGDIDVDNNIILNKTLLFEVEKLTENIRMLRNERDKLQISSTSSEPKNISITHKSKTNTRTKNSRKAIDLSRLPIGAQAIMLKNNAVTSQDSENAKKIIDLNSKIVSSESELKSINTKIKNLKIKEYYDLCKWINNYILRTLYSNNLPSSGSSKYTFVSQKSFTYKYNHVPDCGETTTMNLIRLLIWDNELAKTNIKYLPINTNNKLISFFKKYDDDKLQNSDSAHEDFAHVVSSIKDVKYNRDSAYELVPSFDNVIKILLYLFDIKYKSKEKGDNKKNKFDLILSKIRNPNEIIKKYIIKNTSSNHTTIEFTEMYISFSFTPVHGSFGIIEKNKGLSSDLSKLIEYTTLNKYITYYQKQYQFSLNLYMNPNKNNMYDINSLSFFVKYCIDKPIITLLNSRLCDVSFITNVYNLSTTLYNELYDLTYDNDNNIIHLIFENSKNNINNFLNFLMVSSKNDENMIKKINEKLCSFNRDNVLPLDYLIMYTDIDTIQKTIHVFGLDLKKIYLSKFNNFINLMYIVSNVDGESKLHYLIDNDIITKINGYDKYVEYFYDMNNEYKKNGLIIKSNKYLNIKIQYGDNSYTRIMIDEINKNLDRSLQSFKSLLKIYDDKYKQSDNYNKHYYNRYSHTNYDKNNKQEIDYLMDLVDNAISIYETNNKIYKSKNNITTIKSALLTTGGYNKHYYLKKFE
jgi:hypothetical protein